jgi:hypothetical protein
MRDFLILFVHLIVTVARLARPGGLRSVVAESALVRHQLLVLNRGRKRAGSPRLRRGARFFTAASKFEEYSVSPCSMQNCFTEIPLRCCATIR